MVNAHELIQAMNNDGGLRDTVFIYHFTNGRYGGPATPEYQARQQYETELRDQNAAADIANIYLAANRNLRVNVGGAGGGSGFSSYLGKGVAAFGASTGVLIFGAMVPNDDAGNWIMLAGGAGIAASLVAMLAKYIENK